MAGTFVPMFDSRRSVAPYEFAKVSQRMPFKAPLGTPFSVKMSLTSVAGARGAQNDTFVALGQDDFAHALRFVSGEPVFNLPAGMTVNSLDAGILDNRYSVTDTTPSEVPEPASVTLVGLGLVAVARRRLWRKRTERIILPARALSLTRRRGASS